MTIKEKAKAYDEAIEIAKEYKEKPLAVYSDVLCEKLFPELVEGEDARMRKKLIEIVKAMKCSTAGELKEKHQLLSYLEKQEEQRPAEWSEEDEAIYKEILQNFESVKFKEHHYATGKYTYAQVIAWLKSLRPQPHWKPSEEQMGSLLKAEGKMRRLRFIAIASHLAELYEQLKKLI